MITDPHTLFSGIFITTLACLALQAYRRVTKKPAVSFLPCPPNAKWLWGHELEAFERPCGDFYTEWIDAYGPTYRMKGAISHNDILVLGDPTGVAHMFRNGYNYPTHLVIQSLIERVVGRGLFWVQDMTEHKRMRHLINPAFSAQSVKMMSPAVYDSARKLQTRLANEVLKNDGGATVNILDFSSGATLDIIGRVGFDHDFGHGSSPEAVRIKDTWRMQSALGMKYAGFIASTIIRVFPFIASLPFKVIQAQGEVKTIVKELASKLTQDEQEAGDGASLLSILMRASLKDQNPISKDELLDQICTFVMAGHESTSISLAFTLWALAQNPEAQRRLREEALGFPGDPTYGEFQTKLPYLDACCREGLRLYPALPLMVRVAENDDVIPLHFPFTATDGTKHTSIRVEKGQVVHVPSISLNRLKSVWGDGEAFRPERWLESTKGGSDVKIEGWSNIFTFSDGPRNCVGYRLAVFELKALLFTLVRNFVFDVADVEVIPKFFATLQPFAVGQKSESSQLPLKLTLV